MGQDQKGKNGRGVNLAAARACPTSCVHTEMMEAINIYPISANETLNPETCGDYITKHQIQFSSQATPILPPYTSP